VLYRKPGVHNRVDAVVHAVEWGLLSPVESLVEVFEGPSPELVVEADRWSDEVIIRRTTSVDGNGATFAMRPEEVDSLIVALSEAQAWPQTVQNPKSNWEI
jgi:hypothetical protein